MTNTITKEILLKLAPRVSGARAARQSEICAQIAAHWAKAQEAADLTAPLRQAHFLAQLGHESDGFCAVEEYASGAAYEGRRDLGNVQPGDGRRYKGRGLIQITGRANYAVYDKWARGGIERGNYVAHSELLAKFPDALMSAAFYWQTRRLNIFADRDDLITVTNIINCGRESCKANGGPSRAQYLARAKQLLGASEEAALPEVMRRGDKGPAVQAAQKQLKALGLLAGAADGIYGANTVEAVKKLQTANGLKADGIIGPATAAPLFAPAPMTLAEMQASLSR